MHPSHGSHRFNPKNEEDRQLLEQLKEENSKWSNMIIDVWANRDYKKAQVAQQNNLNYIQLYPESIYEKLSELMGSPEKDNHDPSLRNEEGAETIESSSLIDESEQSRA